MIKLTSTTSDIVVYSEADGDTAPTGLKGTGAFLLLLWEHVEDETTANSKTIFRWQDQTNTDNLLRIYHNSSGQFFTQYKDSAGTQRILTAGDTSDYVNRRVGETYLHAFLYDGTATPQATYRVLGTDGTDVTKTHSRDRFDSSSVNTAMGIGSSSTIGYTGDAITSSYGFVFRNDPDDFTIEGDDNVLEGVSTRMHYPDIFFANPGGS